MKKTFLCATFISCLSVSMVHAEDPVCWSCPSWQYGDTNGDGYVNGDDVLSMNHYHGAESSAYPCADMNMDGYIAAGDSTPILNNFGLGDGVPCGEQYEYNSSALLQFTLVDEDTGQMEFRTALNEPVYLDIIVDGAPYLANTGELDLAIDGPAEFLGNLDLEYDNIQWELLGVKNIELVDPNTLRLQAGYVSQAVLSDALIATPGLAIGHIGVVKTGPGEVLVHLTPHGKTDPRRWGSAVYSSITGSDLYGDAGPTGSTLILRDMNCRDCPWWANGDANGDGYTNGSDVTPILNNFGATSPPGTVPWCYDLNDDGFVEGSDVTPIVNNFGTGPGGTCDWANQP